MVASVAADRDVDLVIAGECWVEWDDYEALIDRLDVADRVHRYPGYIPEDRLERFFVAADAVALPYEYFDAQSGVAGLADHFGTVSIGYDVGGLAEQVDVVADDRAAFERALVAAIDGEVDKRPVDDDAVDAHLRLYERLLDEDDETRSAARRPGSSR
jgi:glycosyltransferase involved in cell wall biosynthesis